MLCGACALSQACALSGVTPGFVPWVRPLGQDHTPGRRSQAPPRSWGVWGDRLTLLSKNCSPRMGLWHLLSVRCHLGGQKISPKIKIQRQGK